jgi:hypothetical protein
MSNVVDITEYQDNNDVEYSIGDDGKVSGVSHSNLSICFNDAVGNVDIICKITGETVDKISKSDFSSTLIAWLLINKPDVINQIEED